MDDSIATGRWKNSRGQRMKLGELVIGQDGDDEEDGVAAPFDGFQNLAFINDEILAQKRQLHCGANLAEIIERALKELFVRQNGKAGGAGGLIFPGDAHGVEVRANHTGGG